MIAIIRITGLVKLNKNMEETLSRLRMRKKYTCVLIKESEENMKMLGNIRNFVAYGKINEETLVQLIKARAKIIGQKGKKVENPEKIAKELIAGKSLMDLGLKPFFGLHPARGGIESKLHYPRGVLGDHKEDINKLIMRML